MMSRLWDLFVETLMVMFLPAVCTYHLITADLFLNVAASNAEGLEKAGNALLAPFQYLFAGRTAYPQSDGSWKFVQTFDYYDAFWMKTSASIFAAAPSLFVGGTVKALGYLSKSARERHASLHAAKYTTPPSPNVEQYRKWGIELVDFKTAERFSSQGHKRRPGDEHLLKSSKEALRVIGKILNDAKIPWWADCGTCLGTYRYGGIIPWDDDIDIAILVNDFENARRALNRLNPDRFHVQDWSSRSFPDTFFKIYLKDSGEIFDIFCFKIDPDKKEIASIFSLDEAIFFPEWFKIRERRFCSPASFDTVFPLKVADFDGVPVFVPNKPKEYLQRYYGENLDPAKVYDPTTGRFEKDLSHPYWQRPYVH